MSLYQPTLYEPVRDALYPSKKPEGRGENLVGKSRRLGRKGPKCALE
jgi:hypothetical protein